jgi:hypothetical protein
MKKRAESFKVILSAFTMLAFLMMPLATNAQAGKTDFSGTWAMNAEKSNLGQGQGAGQGQPPQGAGQGQGQRMGGGNFIAKQEGNVLTVERTRTGQDGQAVTTKSVYTLDGKESVNTTARGESKSVATWGADGKTLKIVTTSVFGERTMTSTEEWALTDANILSIKATRPSQNGESVSTRVYDKK